MNLAVESLPHDEAVIYMEIKYRERADTSCRQSMNLRPVPRGLRCRGLRESHNKLRSLEQSIARHEAHVVKDSRGCVFSPP